MANPKHAGIIEQGAGEWNAWRTENPDSQPDLRNFNFNGMDLDGANLIGADLREADLSRVSLEEADLTRADLNRADLSHAYLFQACLSWTNLRSATLREANLQDADLSYGYLLHADLSRADLHQADLSGACLKRASLTGVRLSWARLRKANLSKADLSGADLREAKLTDANLTEANPSGTILISTNLEGANLTSIRAYGVSAWDLKLAGSIQKNIIITSEEESVIQVDDLEIAQFVYLLLNNTKIRDVIDTITSKVVLILGRFNDERKAVLDALRTELRRHDYLPILFDFEKPSSRDITETVSTLAHLARFVIADITDAKSIPQELSSIVPHLPSVPVQPLLLASQREYAMFEHFRRFPWVLPDVFYEKAEELIASLEQKVIRPAEVKVKEIRGEKTGQRERTASGIRPRSKKS